MAPETMRFLFLALLAVVIFLALIRVGGAIFGLLGDLLRAALNVAIVFAGLGLVAIFFIMLFRIDPMPYIRAGAYFMSFEQNVSYEVAIPSNLEQSLHVTNIQKVDTDTDGFEEWVVFYRFDRRGDLGPIEGVVYDNDRGNPPVIFPYALRPPDRDYLSEGGVSLEMRQITIDQSNPETDPLEIVVNGDRELSVFRFSQNSEQWDFPRDAPPRYQPIGFFRGSHSATINGNNSVTVVDRGGYERSQLMVRSIYQLNPATNTYWDQFYGPAELDRRLAAPTFTTVDFVHGPPDDILEASYPEGIVLGFYAATCQGEDSSLCSAASAGWNPGSFLAGDALREFENNNPGYFDLASFQDTRNLAVTDLAYYPSLETDPDLLVTGGGRDVVTGEEGQRDVVDISFKIDGAPRNTTRYKMDLINGQWKITQRLPFTGVPEFSSPVRISTSPSE